MVVVWCLWCCVVVGVVCVVLLFCCCVVVSVVCVCLVRGACVVAPEKPPRVDPNTPPCVDSNRPRVYRQHVRRTTTKRNKSTTCGSVAAKT